MQANFSVSLLFIIFRYSLKQEKCILSQFRGPAVESQGVSRTMIPSKSPGENHSLPHPASSGSGYTLVCGCKTPVSVFTGVSSLGVFPFL